MCGRKEFIKPLLNMGANPNIKDTDGMTPIQLADSSEIKSAFSS
jgi:ankyrin repeat protein